MGRLRTKTGRIYRRNQRSSMKAINVRIAVMRSEEAPHVAPFKTGLRTGAKAFVACANFKTGGFVKLAPNYEPEKMHGTCSFGKNPRKAIAAAMRKAARHVAGRGGAFAMAGYSRTHRKIRRHRRAGKRRY